MADRKYFAGTVDCECGTKLKEIIEMLCLSRFPNSWKDFNEKSKEEFRGEVANQALYIYQHYPLPEPSWRPADIRQGSRREQAWDLASKLELWAVDRDGPMRYDLGVAALLLRNLAEALASESPVVAGSGKLQALSEDGLPSVAGDSCSRSLADFERAARVAIGVEQCRTSPDNQLIALLCDAVRIKREYVTSLGSVPGTARVAQRCGATGDEGVTCGMVRGHSGQHWDGYGMWWGEPDGSENYVAAPQQDKAAIQEDDGGAKVIDLMAALTESLAGRAKKEKP